MPASVIPLRREPAAAITTDFGPRDVYPDIVCRRCEAPMRDCPVCRARDRYPLHCPSCPHDCEAPPMLSLDHGVDQAIEGLRQAGRRTQARRAANGRVRRLAARKRAAGRCYSCPWTGEALIHRTGLCARHYEQMRQRRNAWKPST